MIDKDAFNSADEITVDDQAAKIFEWRRGFNAMHLIDLGVRLGLFKALADRPDVSPAQLAGNLGLHEPYVDTWCTTCYSFGLLEGDEDRRFRLAPHFDQILANPGHPRYLGGFVRLGTEFATDDHRFCLQAFKTGETIPFQGRSDEFADVIAQSTNGLQVLSAKKIMPELPGLKSRLDAGGTVAEIGCGTGQHLIKLAKEFPGARFVGVDIDPTGIRAARSSIEQAGLGDRISIMESTIDNAVEPGSVEAVVMVQVLHEISPEVRQDVMHGCFQALKPGGWLLVIDETYPSTLEESRQDDYLFPVQTGFEELTWGNVVPTKEEQETLLGNAGFSDQIGRSIVGGGFTVLTTRKPVVA